jgi:hypothetical protein
MLLQTLSLLLYMEHSDSSPGLAHSLFFSKLFHFGRQNEKGANREIRYIIINLYYIN